MRCLTGSSAESAAAFAASYHASRPAPKPATRRPARCATCRKRDHGADSCPMRVVRAVVIMTATGASVPVISQSLGLTGQYVRAILRKRGLLPTAKTPGMSNAEYLRLRRAEAVRDGLCLECRLRRPRDGVKTCDVCLQRANDRTEQYRLRGKCDCGKRPVPGYAQCRRCKDLSSAQGSRSYAKHVADGICPRCENSPTAPNRKQCTACLDRMAANAMRLYIEKTPTARPWQRRCSVCHELGHLASRHTRGTAP